MPAPGVIIHNGREGVSSALHCYMCYLYQASGQGTCTASEQSGMQSRVPAVCSEQILVSPANCNDGERACSSGYLHWRTCLMISYVAAG